MIAGLERHERGRAGGAFTRETKRHRFSVLGPGAFVPSLGDDTPVADQDAADQRVG